MDDVTPQEKKWEGEFGNKYTQRNPTSAEEADNAYKQGKYGVALTELNGEFLGKLSRSVRILEVGTNTGTQLMVLQKMGFKNLYGIEINRRAVDIAKSITKNINIIRGSALDIPFKDNYFDLVFTAGVLIHISPLDIKKAMKEIHRCAKKYILGTEYYADKYTEVLYRKNKNMLWKTNFPKLYLKFFKNLKLIKEKKLKYLDGGNTDIIFLLKKT